MGGDTPGQRLLASVVDVCFFGLVGFLAYLHILTEQAILPILLLYARERFAVAQQKTTMQMVTGSGPSMRPPGDGGSGGSGSMGAVIPPAPTPPRDEKTFVRRVSAYLRHPVIVSLALIACLSKL